MIHSLKRSIGALSVIALLGTTLPTVIAQTVPPTVQILDNASTTGFTKTGNWYTVSDSASYAGKYLYALAGASTTKAVWTFTNLTPGQYKVSVTYRPKSYFSTKAEFRVFDGGVTGKDLGATTVNETVRASSGDINGIPWQTLGTAGGHYAVLMNSLSVTLSANSSAWVQADAVRIERVGNLTGEEMLRDFAKSGSVSPLPSGGEGEGSEVSDIRVLLLYTADLPTYLGLSDTGTEAYIQRSFSCDTNVDTTCPVMRGVPISVNGIMRTSGVPAQFTIARFVKITATTIDNTDDMLYTTNASAQIEELRRLANADIVVTVVARTPLNNNLGRSNTPRFTAQTSIDMVLNSQSRYSLMPHVFNAHFSAHSVVRADKNDKLLTAMIFAHEIGHVLGMGHEIQTGSTFTEPWSYAFNVDGGVKTIDASIAQDGMSPGCPILGCVLIPLFSNPNLTTTINGRTYRLGVPNESDNVRTMTKMARLVAEYSERPFITSLYNPENCLDTSGDSLVTPVDPLRVINYLNAESPQQEIGLITDLRRVLLDSGYIDTNNDGFITPIDALRVINYLNDRTNPAFAPATVCPH